MLIPVAINNRVCLAIVDTGAYKTVLDVEMAKALGVTSDCHSVG